LIPSEYLERQFDEHLRVARDSRERLTRAFEAVLGLWVDAVRGGHKLLFIGNGGSAADAQHFAAEMTIRYTSDREPIAAIALTTDTSALTACSNDLGADRIFARQVEALGRPGDVVTAISTSGRSPNILAAVRTARERGLKVAAFTGGSGGELAKLADAALVVPSEVTARIQEMHLTIGHALCGALELELGMVRE
jgi:D-sedoheptulose 7-phosphate isomerase